DDQRRVKRADVAGDGGDAAGGLGTYTYTYTPSTNAPGENAWAMKTVETLPDGSTDTVYTNAYAQVMLKAHTASGQTWATYYQYDAQGRLALAAAPSAVSGYSDAYP